MSFRAHQFFRAGRLRVWRFSSARSGELDELLAGPSPQEDEIQNAPQKAEAVAEVVAREDQRENREQRPLRATGGVQGSQCDSKTVNREQTG